MIAISMRAIAGSFTPFIAATISRCAGSDDVGNAKLR